MTLPCPFSPVGVPANPIHAAKESHTRDESHSSTTVSRHYCACSMSQHTHGYEIHVFLCITTSVFTKVRDEEDSSLTLVGLKGTGGQRQGKE